MPYPEEMVHPMREELTRLGVEELTRPEAVDEAMRGASEGLALIVVNSICGCAAGNARPAVALALQSDDRPEFIYTVFAGQDLEATARMREYLEGIPPSSPSMALFKGGRPVYAIERRHIEGRSANEIASDLVEAFTKYAQDGNGGEGVERPDAVETPASGTNRLPPTFRSIL